MSNKFKFNATYLWVGSVVVSSIALFAYLFESDAPTTESKIRLTYFADEQEIVSLVGENLAEQIGQNQSYWIGIEPMKDEQIEVALRLKSFLEQKKSFQKIIVDEELRLPEEILKKFSPTDTLLVKENFEQLGTILSQLESEKVSYLVVTASVYSNTLLGRGPLRKIKEKFPINPMTFSIAYMPTKPEDEGKMLFTCDTDDRSGANDWACMIVNKARSTRRRLDAQNPKVWTGLMDSSTTQDYIILLNKKNISG